MLRFTFSQIPDSFPLISDIWFGIRHLANLHFLIFLKKLCSFIVQLYILMYLLVLSLFAHKDVSKWEIRPVAVGFERLHLKVAQSLGLDYFLMAQTKGS